MSDHRSSIASAPLRIRRILDPSYPLCREDVVWVLHFVQKKWLRRIQPCWIFQSHDCCKTSTAIAKPHCSCLEAEAMSTPKAATFALACWRPCTDFRSCRRR